MALLDFLTQGQPVQAVPTSSTSETVLPDWYTNYAMQILSNQDAIANTPYTAYAGPRVADLTAEQQAGNDLAKQASTSYQPLLTQATGALRGLAGRSGYDVAKPSLTDAATYYGTSATPTGITMANPYLAAAGKTSVDNIGQYMNPYTNSVVDRIGVMAGRNLQENLLPQINDRFTGAGTFGGSRQAEAIGKTLRDLQESTLAQQTSALQQGYTQATGLQQGDLARQAELARTAGSLGQTQQQILQSAGHGIGALGATAGGLYNTDTINQGNLSGKYADLAQQTQTMGLTGAGALQQIGAQQQALNQKNLDAAYQDFQAQQKYAQDQVTAQIAALQGVKGAVPTGTMTQKDEVPSAFSPSVLDQLVSTATGIPGILDAFKNG